MDKKWICIFCNKEIYLKSSYSKTGHLAKCVEWKKYKKNILTKEYIKREYIDNGRSAIEIAKEHGLGSATSILNRLKKFNIKKRNISDSKLQEQCQKKFKETCLERYGAINPLSKNTAPYNKRNTTVKERYGVDNVFQIESIINKINDDNYWLQKYGMTKSEYCSERSKKVWKNLSKNEKISWLKRSIWKNLGNFSSKLEDRVYSIICNFNSSVTRQFCIKTSYYDFIIDNKLIIEVNGDFWHANPRKYKKNDVLKFPNSNMVKAKSLWKKDMRRKMLAEKNGYKLIYLWEDEIVKYSDEEITDLLLNRIKEIINEN